MSDWTSTVPERSLLRDVTMDPILAVSDSDAASLTPYDDTVVLART
jgi:hypothetical protein